MTECVSVKCSRLNSVIMHLSDILCFDVQIKVLVLTVVNIFLFPALENPKDRSLNVAFKWKKRDNPGKTKWKMSVHSLFFLCNI